MKKLLLGLLAIAAVAGLSLPSQNAVASTYQATYATVNVYARTAPSTTASTTYLYQGGQVVYYYCYTTGTSVNGDNVWYWTRPNPQSSYAGYVAGWWLETGADPNGKVAHC